MKPTELIEHALKLRRDRARLQSELEELKNQMRDCKAQLTQALGVGKFYHMGHMIEISQEFHSDVLKLDITPLAPVPDEMPVANVLEEVELGRHPMQRQPYAVE